MEDRYRNRYRTSSARLTGWDYGSCGLYFVTICTKDRVRYFGEIENLDAERRKPETQSSEKQSIVSLRATEIGEIAIGNWTKILSFHPYAEPDEFVVMPDHIHGILFINKPGKVSWEINKFGPQRNNLASIIRGYKSSVKTYATINNIDFAWQPGYYDRVIRNENEYIKVREYIYYNPDQWFQKEDNYENLFKL